MALKSYRLSLKKGKRKKKRRGIGARDLVTGGVGAIIGVAFVGQTADVLSTL
ncbi:hypothetical protein LCGC14_1237200 [marine sediment metagenome]|uniref:Uncharacterized protein n=1 Tax=marine sediment metagenome TaxID=412755 RepID=A0A0F9PB41_9ZZZZ